MRHDHAIEGLIEPSEKLGAPQEGCFADDQDTVGTHINSLFPGPGMDPNFIAFDQGFVQLNGETCDPSMDVDTDGWCDSNDNCLNVANSDQTDTDRDGFGNACDSDFNNNLVVGIPDFNILRAGFGGAFCDSGLNSDLDADWSGKVGIPDFNVLRSQFGGPPGPSGLSCAGTVPCLGSDTQGP